MENDNTAVQKKYLNNIADASKNLLDLIKMFRTITGALTMQHTFVRIRTEKGTTDIDG